MEAIEVVKRFVKSSSLAARAALNSYEWLPLSFRYRVFYGPAFFQWLSFLKESENWDKDKFDSYQFEQTKNLLLHSMRNVPHYRNLFRELGFSPERMQSLDDVTSLPYLKKETVRNRPADFVDERIPLKVLIKKFTSGSTGIPLTIYRSRESEAAFHAFRANLLGRIGHDLKSREVMLWAFIELGGRKNLPFVKYGNKLILSVRYLTGEWLLRYCEMMRKFDPEYLSGYPSALAVLSSFIRKNNLAPCKHIVAVVSYAETLYDWQRESIEGAFGARVFSMYSMTEYAALGGECEHSTDLHIYPQHCLTELKETAEDYKEVVATGFTNYAMPFIRYLTGDLVRGVEEFCPKCGRSHKIFGSIEGRIHDFLIGRNGEIISRLMPWIKVFPNTKQYQFSQEEMGKVYVKIVRAEAYSESDTAFIRSTINEMLGPIKDAIDIEIIFVDDIQRTSLGKVKMVEQKLDMKDFLAA